MKRTPLKRKTPLKRSAMPRGKGPSLRRTPLRKVNPERGARRLKAYRAVLASDFHKRLRYQAWERSGGLCECEQCVAVRKVWGKSLLTVTDVSQPYTVDDVWRATIAIPIYFTDRAGEPWQRFRSKDGQLHHTSYKYFGQENPDELRLVRWTWATCHDRIEASQNTRRRYLRTGK